MKSLYKLSKVTQRARDRASMGSGSVAASADTWWWSRLGQPREPDTMCSSCSVSPSEPGWGPLGGPGAPSPHHRAHCGSSVSRGHGKTLGWRQGKGPWNAVAGTGVGLQGHTAQHCITNTLWPWGLWQLPSLQGGCRSAPPLGVIQTKAGLPDWQVTNARLALPQAG